MIRENLEAIPEFALPAEFALRWYRPGDEAHWRAGAFAAERRTRRNPKIGE